jgi:hypothetical protein
MTEDEAFTELEERQRNAPKVLAALYAPDKAQQFVEETGVELGIYTLRKAFEVGYQRGYWDATNYMTNKPKKAKK